MKNMLDLSCVDESHQTLLAPSKTFYASLINTIWRCLIDIDVYEVK